VYKPPVCGILLLEIQTDKDPFYSIVIKENVCFILHLLKSVCFMLQSVTYPGMCSVITWMDIWSLLWQRMFCKILWSCYYGALCVYMHVDFLSSFAVSCWNINCSCEFLYLSFHSYKFFAGKNPFLFDACKFNIAKTSKWTLLCSIIF
jgi:hypothetical protein